MDGPTVRESAVEDGGAEAARPLGKTVKKRSALFWALLLSSILVTVVAGAFTFMYLNPRIQARHDVQVIAFGMDGFAMENGDYPRGTRGEICRMLRGESINSQNPKKLDYVEAMPTEMDGSGAFVDPWGQPYRISVDKKARVYSCGPNRRDENGEGDDIISWK